MRKDNILVIGACGQIGADLVPALRRIHGDQHVVAADIRPLAAERRSEGPYIQLDALNYGALSALISKHDINQVYLLAARLSATGEQHPQKAWDLNMQSLLNLLNLAREKKLAKIFWPSSIAVFGPDAPKKNCPQLAPQRPATVYGISKAAGEQWCQYYWNKYRIDTRSLRYPGLISHKSTPGGGTTDYAVDIFHRAIADQQYTCFLEPNTMLPMMYMPDAIRATLELMEAPASKISVRSSYNLAAMSFTPATLAACIERYIPAFRIRYEPDYRQTIADSWPQTIDDALARSDWGWDHEFELSATTKDMIAHLAKSPGLPLEQILEQLPGGFY
jgi:nucleoside-diphosphate-sugar epimerase